MRNLWQMQLHPGEADWDLKEFDKLILQHSVIGMGNEWKNDRGAPSRFKEDMQIGDIVVLRHQGSPRYLVEVISPCIRNEDEDKIDVWFAIYRKVRVLSNKGEDYKEYYKSEEKKNWTEGLYAPTTFQNANDWDFAHYWYNKIIKKEKMKHFCELIENNKNLILTGAPGTGKTYLAQQIAKEIGCNESQMGFVQFHPSYDYTDFVEGLRPKQDECGNIGFEPKDGIFKKFCENALLAYLSDADNAPKFVFIIDEINRGEISKIFGELFFSVDSGYRVTKKMIDNHKSGKSSLVTIRTQYSNMCKSPNAFDEALGITDPSDFGHFFVPDNVYIIGTMNDIDRSVESMDFAFRRRFAFEEIKADKNLGMLEGMTDKEKIINRMNNLNAAIEKIEGLSSAYHIGGSYFIKLKLYQKEDNSYDYEALWNNHLKGLLMEYLRGMADAEKKVEELKKKYENESKDVNNE